ncbi:hypothetical protein HN873_021605 [Arachis hypogaea]
MTQNILGYIIVLTNFCIEIIFGSGEARKPIEITKTSSKEHKSLYETWKRSNRLCLNLMRMTMAENVKPSMPKIDNAKNFMAKVKKYFQ